MTGIPDAEAAWQELVARYPRGNPSMPVVDWGAMEAAFKAGFAAAAPWRENVATQIMDELREFLPEWDYPPHVVSAICLELKERLAL